MKVNLIINTVMQEKQRIDNMLLRYREELSRLPKGTISEKSVNGNIYYYLKYREGKKVISKYIKKNEVEDVRQQLERRHHIEAMIKSLLEEQALATKMLEGAV